MHHDFIDRYSRAASPIHRIPSAQKMLGAIFIIVTITVMPLRFAWFFIFAGIALMTIVVMSKVPTLFFVKRLLFLEPFVAGVALLALFHENGGVIFASIVVRSSLSLVTILLLTNTTPFAEMLKVLRRYRFSPVFITILALMYRYLFVLIDELERMKRARMSRSFQKNNLQAWQMLSMTIGQLFIRSSERAERIYAAMCARGWK